MSPARPARRRLRASAVVLALVAAFAVGARPVLISADPVPAAAPGAVFSADRAMVHVERVARGPHPVGSPEMAGVAEYVAAELGRAGVEVVRQDLGSLHNVIGRVRGADPTGAVLFVSHADSVAQGPGAGDNAAGAATLVELARALAARAPLRNDVILLVEDGEERGFLGGGAFAAAHGWMAGVRVVIGLDTAAWGSPGVIQTSDDNGLLVQAYADGVDRPNAFSLVSATGADSDYETSPFRARGIPTMEIEDTYADVDQHTARDTVDRVDRGRVQQLGDQALGLAASLGQADLRDPARPDRVFHSLPLVGLVHYPASWDVALVALELLGVAAAITVGIRRGRLRGKRVAAAAALGAALVTLTVVLAAVLAGVYDRSYPNPNATLSEYLLPSSAPFALAAAAVLLVGFGVAYDRLGRRLGRPEVAVGFLSLAAVLGALLTVTLPGAEVLLVWSGLVAIAAWLTILWRPSTSPLVLSIPALVAAVVTAPLVFIGYFGGGIADLPVLALFVSVVAGAFVGPAVSIHRFHGARERGADHALAA